ncbi:MAG TPA: PadR family transcriptional regulator [Thermoanaerobaculia bacterium]|nr:PadR family transcriptional regulator [Thermoanaerobaculia bacterium]
MTQRPLDLVQGTLDLLVLGALTAGPRHGYGVMRFIRETSGDELQIEEGALYPALHRLEARRLIEAEWGRSENQRRAKFYRLTADGRQRLRRDAQSWRRYVVAVGRILETAG